MNKRLTIGLFMILIASVAVLIVQNHRLHEKIEKLAKTEEVKITPVTPQSGLANPPGASPFDKPNVDPMANQLPPESPPASERTSIQFERMTHNFGKIKEGDKVKTVFKFTNTGKNPLIISSAMGSCGCTVPRWPKSAISPGESDEIAVEFNSEGKNGETEKTVTVNANTDPPVSTLIIKSTIIPKNK